MLRGSDFTNAFINDMEAILENKLSIDFPDDVFKAPVFTGMNPLIKDLTKIKQPEFMSKWPEGSEMTIAVNPNGIKPAGA